MCNPKKIQTLVLVALLIGGGMGSSPFAKVPKNAALEKKYSESIKKLKSKKAAERRFAAETLGRLNDLRAVNPLIKALKDKDEGVRNSAAFSLGMLKSPKAVKPLLKSIEKDPSIRIFAIRSLGFIKDPKSIPTLKQMLSNSDPNVVVEAAFALSEFNDESLGAALTDALKTSDDYGCQAIVDVLKKKKSKGSEKILIDIVDQSQTRPTCSLSAASALGFLGGAYTVLHFKRMLKKDLPPNLHKNILASLGRLQAKEAVSDITPFLSSPDAGLRKSAVEALMLIGEPASVPQIKKRLKDSDEGVKKAAAHALKQMGAK